MVWQLHVFITHFTQNKWQQIIAIAFVFCDPTILAQCFYIGQEIPQLFFFLLALNQLLKGNYIVKCIALLCLSLCSLRGMMLCGGFFILEVVYCKNIIKNTRQIFTRQNIICYAMASSAAVIFITWRLFHKGYIQTHQGSQWEDLWHFASIEAILNNIKILIHRFLDFGRIAVITFLISVLYIYRKEAFKNKKIKLLLAATLLSTGIIAIISLVVTNTIGHRYFALSFLLMHLLALYILQTFIANKKALILFLFSIVLVTGNLWQYP